MKGRALFYGASKNDKLSGGDDNTGRQLWLDFQYCVILKEQHRFGSDAGMQYHTYTLQ